MKHVPEIEVFHDGQCPVCRIEVRFYERLDRPGAIRWTDITALDNRELPSCKDREELLGKFHVRDLPPNQADSWYIGVDAFARIWQVLPYFRWFAWIFRMPVIRQIAQLAYLAFLRWQSAHRRKQIIGTNAGETRGRSHT